MKPIFNLNNFPNLSIGIFLIPKLHDWFFGGGIVKIFLEWPTFLGEKLKFFNVSNMPNIIGKINSKTTQNVLNILEIFYYKFF
jgi:hypothetical protein